MVAIGKWSLIEDGEDLKLMHYDDLSKTHKVHQVWQPMSKGTAAPEIFGTHSLGSAESSTEDHEDGAAPEE